MALKRGVDISAYQNVTSWSKLADAVEFVIVKATEGKSAVSSAWSKHWRNAGEAGVLRGSYHFAHPENSAKAEAQHYVRKLKDAGFQTGRDLPPVLDLEATGGKNQTQLTAWARDFMSEVDRLLDLPAGQKTGLYVNRDYYENRVNGAALVDGRWLWLAAWPGSTAWPASVTKPADVWQFTDKKTVAGISGTADANVATAATLNGLAPRYYADDGGSDLPEGLRTVTGAVAFAHRESRNASRNWHNDCLAFVRLAWNHPLTGTPHARAAWEKATHKHTDKNAPAGAPVYWDTPSTSNFDHVAISDGTGHVFSNDIIRDGKIDRVRIDDPVWRTKWGATYRGWSEDYCGVTMLPLGEQEEDVRLDEKVQFSEAQQAKLAELGVPREDATVEKVLTGLWVQSLQNADVVVKLAKLVTAPLSPEERQALAAEIAAQVQLEGEFVVTKKADEEATE